MADSFLRVPRRSWQTYAVLVGVLVAAKLIFVVIPTKYPGADQATAFSWPIIALIAASGVCGLALTSFAGVVDAWDPRVNNRQRFVLPAVDGAVYGIITVLRDLARPENVHLAFPLSIPFYAFGAVLLEVLLRLFALTALTVLLWRVLFRGRAYPLAFWIANIVVALYEPLPFIQQELASAPRIAVPGIIVDWAFQPLFLANVLTGYIYRKNGIVAAVVLRLAFYAVWHVAYGGFRGFWLAL